MYYLLIRYAFQYYYRALCLSDLLPNWYAYRYLHENVVKVFPDAGDNTTIQNQLAKLFESMLLANTGFCQNSELIFSHAYYRQH